MKIALAQITTLPGRIEPNTAAIIATVKKARSLGAEVVVFPELAVPGYASLDLVYSTSFISRNLKALEMIAEASQDITVVVGFIDRDSAIPRSGGRPTLYNSAAVLRDGRIVGVQDKTLLPNYDIFFEDRYFVSARGYQVFKIGTETIGIQICEDLWERDYSEQIIAKLRSLGASTIINISASPFHIGKLTERQKLIESMVQSQKVDFVYVNLVGGFDGFEGEIAFDGASMVYRNDGALLGLARHCEEDLLFVDTSAAEPINATELDWKEPCYSALVMGIKHYFARNNLKRAYIGLSGGIDSSLVASLAVAALGAEKVIGVTMPSHITSKETKNDAINLARTLGIQCIERSIAEEYQAWLHGFTNRHAKEPNRLTKQNKQARIRGSILMEYTNEDSGSIVLNTGNKTELAVGYCTLYGDMCGGLAVIGDLSKERVYSLSRFVNQLAGENVIPESVLERIPSAELEPQQTDRDNLPADYPILSPLVEQIVDEGADLALLSNQYGEKTVLETARLIHLNEYKRRQAAPSIRVTRKAFGIGRRIPIAWLA